MSGTAKLLGDIGATHARFAIAHGDGLAHEAALDTGDYERFEDALRAYLATLPKGMQPQDAAIAIAAPMLGDAVAMINCPWRFSIQAVKAAFGWRRLSMINDFVANALGVPQLDVDHVAKLGEGTAARGSAIAVIGPGTGLGVAALVTDGVRWMVAGGEGGHMTLAAIDGREAAVIDILRRQYAHVSAERVLSGPGLVNLYDALCELAGKPAGPLTPEHVTNLYLGCDQQCREAVTMFASMLGTFAGDVALAFGARGGVYIMGGIVPGMLEFFRHSAFRERFEFKGRYRSYLEAIPTYVVTHPNPAYLGLQTLFED